MRSEQAAAAAAVRSKKKKKAAQNSEKPKLVKAPAHAFDSDSDFEN